MKKLIGIIPIIGLVIILCFAGCTKEITYKIKIKCCYSETGIDTGAVVPGTYIKIGKDNYADFAQAEGYTDANGEFEYTFKYEALLDVTASFGDTITGNNYYGSGQIKLLPDELVEETILMMRQ